MSAWTVQPIDIIAMVATHAAGVTTCDERAIARRYHATRGAALDPRPLRQCYKAFVASKSKLVLLENGSARPVDAHALPKLIEDARDDADALAALVEIALELGGVEALYTTGAALARLRALESPRAAELS